MTQPDLFNMPTDASDTLFPAFAVEKSEFDRFSKITNTAMRRILEKLGFVVKNTYTHTELYLPTFPLHPGDMTVEVFSVEYPDGWRLGEDVQTAMQEHCPVHFLFDNKHRKRGIIRCGVNNTPLEATLYTRFFAHGPSREDNAQDSNTFTFIRSSVSDKLSDGKVVFIDSEERKKLVDANPSFTSGVEAPILSKEEVEKFTDILVNSAAIQWLNKEYPDWKDPSAYW